MESLVRNRANIAVVLTLLLLGAVIGGTTVPLAHWRFTLDLSLGVGGGLAMIARLDDELRSAWARWGLLGAGVILAGAIGMVARMVVHGLLSRGG